MRKAQAAEKIKPPRWYKGEKFEYENLLKTKGKVVAYFKTEAGRYGGNRKVIRHYKIFENGISVYIDVTMMKTGVCQSMGTPFQLRNSNKREFDTALKNYLKSIS